MALEYVGGKTAAITGSTSTATNVSLTDLTGGQASANGAGLSLVPKPSSPARAVRSTTEPRIAGSVTVAREAGSIAGGRVASIDAAPRATSSPRPRRAA